LSKDAASEPGWSLNADGIACYRTNAGTRMFVPKMLDIYRQHLDRDQVDTPELYSNRLWAQ
jgi:hypothetical protein